MPYKDVGKKQPEETWVQKLYVYVCSTLSAPPFVLLDGMEMCMQESLTIA